MNIEDKQYEKMVELLKACQSVIWKNVLHVNGDHYELVQEIEHELNKSENNGKTLKNTKLVRNIVKSG